MPKRDDKVESDRWNELMPKGDEKVRTGGCSL